VAKIKDVLMSLCEPWVCSCWFFIFFFKFFSSQRLIFWVVGERLQSVSSLCD